MASNASRQLLLLRHVKSACPMSPTMSGCWPAAGDVPVAGRRLRATGHVPDRVICSTARRARETWRLAAAELDASPKVSFDDRVYGAAAAELLDLARETGPKARTLLIVGHDPAMQQLTLMLADAGDGDADALEQARFKFPTAAIAVLEFSGTWPELGPQRARLTSFVVPRDLQEAAGQG